jgi:hypothetical protein
MPAPSTEWPSVAVQIVNQGAVVLAGSFPLSGYARRKYEDLVALYVDLDTDQARLGASCSGPASAPSIEFLPVADVADAQPTELAFPEYVGWRVFAATLYGDELAVVLYRVDEAATESAAHRLGEICPQ